MNLGRLSEFAIGVVIAAALAGNLGTLTRWVERQTAELLWSSRSSTWGSPRFWPEQDLKSNKANNLRERRSVIAKKSQSN